MTSNTEKTHKKADQYNDPTHNYLRYWDGREYEHDAEVLAISRLLKNRNFKHAIDIGGGYGRLSVVLARFADKVTLVEPSQQQLDIAADFLKGYQNIERILMQADDLQYKDGEVDLVAMVRVMHHIPDPMAEFNEISRVLQKDGYLLLEVANYANFKNRIKHLKKAQKMPLEPVDIRSEANKNDNEVAFVNHNPKTVIKQLARAGLKVEKTLSVSNMRSQSLKKILPRSVMLAFEDLMQPTLAKSYFGPSTIFLVRKI